ncbi:MAG: hypothetical protein ACR5KV_03280 [Wolbachia sp.]
MTIRTTLEEECRKFGNKLDSNKQKEILGKCMSNLSYIGLERPIERRR